MVGRVQPAAILRNGDRIVEEDHVLKTTMCFTNELLLMLERAGFSDIELGAGYADEPPTPADDFVVFIAKKA